MKFVLAVLALPFTALFAFSPEAYPYQRDILIAEHPDKPSIVKIKMDPLLYRHTLGSFRDLRIVDDRHKETSYMLKKDDVHRPAKSIEASPSSYIRKELATINFELPEPFRTDKITLNIQDKNFETSINVYIKAEKGQPFVRVVTAYPIFDFTRELGIRQLSIPLKKTQAIRELMLEYDTQKVTFFYYKYKEYVRPEQYLSIPSVTLYKNPKSDLRYDFTALSLADEQEDTQHQTSSYLFDTRSIPFSLLEVNASEQNYYRLGKLYVGDDKKHWKFIRNFTIAGSTFSTSPEGTAITLPSEIKARYIKIVINDEHNTPIHLQTLTLGTLRTYLYFIALPGKKYRLFFGNPKAKKPGYDLGHIVSEQNVSDALKGTLLQMEQNPSYRQQYALSFQDRIAAHASWLLAGGVLFATLFLLYVALVLLKKSEK
jgi:hypothetical protein